MSTPYIGEIRLFAGNFAPVGWLFCDGTTLPISQYDVLFNLIGTTYGGDGQTTFALPDLRGRVPLHQASSGYTLGQQGGVETVTLIAQQMPQHTHTLQATNTTGTQGNPGGNLLANSQGPQPYIQENPDGNLNGQAISSSGGSQPHENMQSFLCINFIIATEGIFPSPS
jgi:microcystin-dependent protein